MPEVETISEYAFFRCVELTDVALPKLTFFDYYSFDNCSNLETMFLPSLKSFFYPNYTALRALYLGRDARPNSAREVPGLTVYYHPEYEAYYEGSRWDGVAKQQVAHAFADPLGIGADIVRITHADPNGDWIRTVERSTDLGDSDGWEEVTASKRPEISTQDGITTESLTFDESAPAAFYRVRARLKYFEAEEDTDEEGGP